MSRAMAVAAVKAVCRHMIVSLKAARQPVDPIDAAIARMQDAVLRSGAAVRQSREAARHAAQRRHDFQQQRGGFAPRLPTPGQAQREADAYARRLNLRFRAEEEGQGVADHEAEGIQIGDQSRGRPTWDSPLLRRNDDWRRLRQDTRDFEDLLHPLTRPPGSGF